MSSCGFGLTSTITGARFDDTVVGICCISCFWTWYSRCNSWTWIKRSTESGKVRNFCNLCSVQWTSRKRAFYGAWLKGVLLLLTFFFHCYLLSEYLLLFQDGHPHLLPLHVLVKVHAHLLFLILCLCRVCFMRIREEWFSWCCKWNLDLAISISIFLWTRTFKKICKNCVSFILFKNKSCFQKRLLLTKRVLRESTHINLKLGKFNNTPQILSGSGLSSETSHCRSTFFSMWGNYTGKCLL